MRGQRTCCAAALEVRFRLHITCTADACSMWSPLTTTATTPLRRLCCPIMTRWLGLVVAGLDGGGGWAVGMESLRSWTAEHGEAICSLTMSTLVFRAVGAVLHGGSLLLVVLLMMPFQLVFLAYS